MNTILWEKIQKFDLDDSEGEYNFTMRLSSENGWTLWFTKQAIDEYKKFMYLAATVGKMVSPSEIIDVVWHQHLIFTQSYSDFCQLLGRRIEHIPSTHNKEEKFLFASAKNRTKEEYESVFGNQPVLFWEKKSFEEGLNINKGQKSFDFYVQKSVIGFIIGVVLFRFVFYEWYLSISNPNFPILFLVGGIFIIIGIHLCNDFLVKKKAKAFMENEILKKLEPCEWITLEKRERNDLIHGYVNYLVVNKKLKVFDKDRLECIDSELESKHPIFKVIISVFENKEKVAYKKILEVVSVSPTLRSIENSTNKIKQAIEQSTIQVQLIKWPLIVFTLWAVLGATRMWIGFEREKPIFIIMLLNIVFIVCVALVLKRLRNSLMHGIIGYFKDEVIRKNKANYNEWEWNYFILGTTLLSTSFLLVASPYVHNIQNNNSSSCSSSCGSSCGGGCGGGCGGCGS